MFIEQSVARRRAVRRVFLVAAAAPCAILLALAWWRHSAAHVEAVERHAEAHLGVPIDIGSVSHPRPGVMRLSGVVVGGTTAADGGLVLPTLEVETAAGEVRVRVSRFDCSPRGARMLAELAVEWLARPARFPKSWVVDVGRAAWLTPDGAAVSAGAGWHVECVAAAEARAVRVRRESPSRDEIRVRTVGGTIAVEGKIEEDLPVAVASAFAGVSSGWADALGPQARVRGTVEATRDERGWSGSFVGVVDRCALGAVGAGGGRDAEGEAVLTWHALRWDAGRVVSCDVGVSSPGGTVSQGLLDRCVGVVGCRPGPAYRALSGDERRPFDELAIRVRFDASGLRFVPVEGRGEGLVRSRGLSLIEPPDGPVSPTGVAWILAPDGRAAVPASPAGAWLISVLPESGAQGDF